MLEEAVVVGLGVGVELGNSVEFIEIWLDLTRLGRTKNVTQNKATNSENKIVNMHKHAIIFVLFERSGVSMNFMISNSSE